MTGELGQLSLCLALALSLVQAIAGLYGGAVADARLMAMTRGASLGVFVFIAVSFGALTAAYLASDFSILAVFQNSHTAKPLLYKLSGVWGNHEGSMLLWVLILSLYSALMTFSRAGGEVLASRALGVQGLVAMAFLLFILSTSNPFLRIYPQPFEGTGLNPLLQDPGLAFHPPLLYFGYVGLSATFAFAVAALLEARNDAAWIRASRPFALTAWTALTLGIAAGSWWAYYTLGWGGFWFWDPVENASLMPWLVCTALFHSMMATERSGAFKSWTLLLAIAAFSFSLIGTFLVRSGVLNSVHAFANDPARGVFILMILFVAIGVPLALFAWRAPSMTPGARFDVASRETGILANNFLLTGAAAITLIGTLYPLLLDAVTGTKLSVGPPYYVATVIPLLAVLALLMPFGPLLPWRRGDLSATLRLLRWALIAALVVAIAALVLFSPASLLGIVAVFFGAWLIGGAATDLHRRAGSVRMLRYLSVVAWATALAHGGLGVLAFGVAGATVWKTENTAVLQPGQSMPIAGYELRLEGTERVDGPNYQADRATITVTSGGDPVTVVHPEKRHYVAEGQITSFSSIRTTGISDLHVVLADPRENNGWVVRAYVNPLAPFIWIGSLIMALGGLCGIVARLRRSRTSRVTVPAAASPAE
jgi:cytochrome c-type biogenesis protein CcmF